MAPDAAGARVRLEHLRHRFEPDPPVLCDVSRVIEAGALVVISGASGSGKSTLLQLIGGLDRPDSGDIWVDETHVSAIARPVEFHRNTVGFVFQLHHLLPAISAQANVELPLVAAHVPRAARHAAARDALQRVGLEDRAAHRPPQLSGGERQRVAIARAIVHRPRLLLADEPTGALDRRSAELILDVLADLSERAGATVIVVSHDPTLSGRARHRLVLADGHLTSATPEHEESAAT